MHIHAYIHAVWKNIISALSDAERCLVSIAVYISAEHIRSYSRSNEFSLVHDVHNNQTSIIQANARLNLLVCEQRQRNAVSLM